uniref:Nucleoplasmin core domain-containing protein n=1 Tax=Chelydra serpentina TaxID=8475 RepID=A0A8C3TL51_CHESE
MAALISQSRKPTHPWDWQKVWWSANGQCLPYWLIGFSRVATSEAQHTKTSPEPIKLDSWEGADDSCFHPKICLGEQAKDEFNVVEIVPSEDSQDTTPVPLATLKPSVLPMVSLTPPVTFRLRAGSGPVYITGQHVTCKRTERGGKRGSEPKSTLV